jgi:hypothetical protein
VLERCRCLPLGNRCTIVCGSVGAVSRPPALRWRPHDGSLHKPWTDLSRICETSARGVRCQDATALPGTIYCRTSPIRTIRCAHRGLRVRRSCDS